MAALNVKLWKGKAFLNGDFQELRRISLELPGYKKFVNDSLLFEPSAKNIEHLFSVPGIIWSGEAMELANSHRDRIEKEVIFISMKMNPENFSPDAESFKFKTTPFDHQKKAFFLSKDAEYYGYFMEMGTGKTKVVIDNAAYLYGKSEIDCLLILAPNGVHSQWIREQIPIHMPDWCNTRGYVYRASDKKSLKTIDDVINETKFKLDSLIAISFNIDALSNEKGRRYIEKVLRTFNCMMVIDESVRIKTPGSLRAKAAMKLAPLAPFRRIMSGAPVTKGYEDLYSQLKFLSPDVLGFNSFYTFRNYHCIMGGFESREIVGYRPNAVKDLEKRIETYTFRITKKECLDLPDKIYTKRYIELTPEQEEIYRRIEKELEIDLQQIKEVTKGGNAVPKEVNTALMTAITKMLRMQQVICGHFVLEKEDLENEVVPVPTNRIDILMDCIHEAQGKIIIWSRFIFDLKAIRDRLKKEGIGYVLYYGEVSGADREKAIDSFRNDENCKVFLAQPASGGTGLNLAVASTVIYFSNDFNADTRWQSEDRAHRIGQKNNVNYIDLIAAKTIDEKILQSLREKKNLADALLDNPRNFLSGGAK